MTTSSTLSFRPTEPGVLVLANVETFFEVMMK